MSSKPRRRYKNSSVIIMFVFLHVIHAYILFVLVISLINLILPSAECRTEKDYCLIVSKKQEKICHCRNRAENIWYVCIESFAT